ncbi:gilatoxin-like [Elgaria multicarinata webbii]|uniref:gilatoxin-like n=1 Tax=Elgaria multicarinata webbii TaxID=159646 RepID=UPI002FCD2643
MEPSKLLAVFLLLLPSFVSAHRKRIIGGVECREDEHPWLVMLYDSNGLICSGILIDNNWVLSAAHCYNRGPMRMKLGTHNKYVQKFHEEQRVSVAAHCYPDAPHTTRNSCERYIGDIMMLKLNKPVRYNKFIAPLRLPTTSASVGAKCRVMGWGSTTAPSQTYPAITRCVDVFIQEKRSCARSVGLRKKNPNILCAGHLNGCQGCWGDSGGPLICDGKLQGIVSYGKPLGLAAYTKVDSYLNWIRGFY